MESLLEPRPKVHYNQYTSLDTRLLHAAGWLFDDLDAEPIRLSAPPSPVQTFDPTKSWAEILNTRPVLSRINTDTTAKEERSLPSPPPSPGGLVVMGKEGRQTSHDSACSMGEEETELTPPSTPPTEPYQKLYPVPVTTPKPEVAPLPAPVVVVINEEALAADFESHMITPPEEDPLSYIFSNPTSSPRTSVDYVASPYYGGALSPFASHDVNPFDSTQHEAECTLFEEEPIITEPCRRRPRKNATLKAYYRTWTVMGVDEMTGLPLFRRESGERYREIVGGGARKKMDVPFRRLRVGGCGI
ncbi:hypothetical protein SAICODRAFT_184558 [Saitoella complicata NRRL Y-17804]|uniref:uncharacterized protein n=1 Tax=Saitoella complicata (strain BCRC 22490 / CBS 7301 / JCM 7358 / NBRC 10748 / NRRL Y-17804) TaxID=698492 RepID=UPI0008670C09|nr:uncharacterized protein SAICODRAFT_184558 [Saitoella complicata NRRL Y-17804]ODQ55393.1 hypothetical protein SAICODRAFT_184558 [Saitoella complicata NRRL Y-17804]